MEYIYTERDKTKHVVRIHNFSRKDKTTVRIIGGKNLNNFDPTYPDKKWVKISELTERESGQPAVFTEEFMETHSL